MTRTRWILVVTLLFSFVLAGWLWWVKPRKVDMARYAPLNSLVYLESDRPLEIIEALAGTDAWKALDEIMENQKASRSNHHLLKLIGFTGIGPVQSVILARSQIAVVVTDLGTTEEGETLRIKPEGAVVIETHTAESRIRPPIEEALKKLADMTYGQPVFRTSTIDGIKFMQWSAPEGGRQIVATIFGSLVIVGNSERAVQNCLTVSRGEQHSLAADPELARMRHYLGSEHALTFGYVPPANSARLLSVAVPLVMGRAPADSDFQRLITSGAAKVFGSLGWSSHAFMSGIEDRYEIGLQPSIIGRLKPAFAVHPVDPKVPQTLPKEVQSVTLYKFEDPASVWQSLKLSVSSQVDTLSAIVFSSLLRAALLSYGIDDPEKFLATVDGSLLTIRIDQNAERSILLANVRDRASLLALLTKGIFKNSRRERLGNAEILEDATGDFAVCFLNALVVMGSPMDVRHYVEIQKDNARLSNVDGMRKITFYSPLSSSANIVTYTNDSDRVRGFISALLAAQSTPLPTSARLEEMLANLPYSATETTLGDSGLERTTRSPLGQFSTLLPLLIPEQPRAISNPQAK